jgi:hypothetical protein
MEVTKWLKPSDSVSRIGDPASVQARSHKHTEFVAAIAAGNAQCAASIAEGPERQQLPGNRSLRTCAIALNRYRDSADG